MRLLIRHVIAIGMGVCLSALSLSPAAAKTVREYQWYLTELNVGQAHQISSGAGVVVAVIDTGVDASHPDLTDQVLTGTGIGADAAPDGRADVGTKGHGTAMASIIAGVGGQANRLLGIAPDAHILPVSLGPTITSQEMAAGIRWAVDHGANVINLSLGATNPGKPTSEEIAAVRYALRHNAVVVASAGNTDKQGYQVHSPGNIKGVITVAGTDRDGTLWDGSSRGDEVVVTAPAVGIIAGVPEHVSTNRYVISDGTSDAAAIVSGVVALVRAEYPEMDAANIVNRLVDTAEDRGPAGRDAEYGFGAIAPMAALTADVSAVNAWPIATPTIDPPATPLSAREWATDRSGIALAVVGVLFGLSMILIAALVAVITARRASRHPLVPFPRPAVGVAAVPLPRVSHESVLRWGYAATTGTAGHSSGQSPPQRAGG